MAITLLILALVTYLSLLFWIASRGDKLQYVEGSWTRNPLVYALALGVYCTSWTFYGLVGTAAENAWKFAPILLGPMLLFVFGQSLLRRVAALCRQENIRSIADFLASRYGKRHGIATSVTLIILIATVPYIALQIKAVTDTLLLAAGSVNLDIEDMGMVTAVAMVVFALLFGVKRLDVSGYHAGLMSAIAFESVTKLIALLFLAFFALMLLGNEVPVQLAVEAWQPFSRPDLGLHFWVETAISAAAIFCLPRMFHVTFVENLTDQHMQKARWVFPLYLGIIGLCIIAIAMIGNANFAASGTSVPADTYGLALPLSHGNQWLALLVFLGGFSAATAMIIVATVTLSHMLSNDVILPLLIRRHRKQVNRVSSDYSRYLMLARRLTVTGVMALAYLYQRALAGNAALTDIGLIAFALVVQLFPALVFGMYSQKGNARGAYAGMVAGCLLWFFTLFIPLLVESTLLSPALLTDGLWDISWLRPQNLFGLEIADAYTRGALISLAFNIGCYWLFSHKAPLQLADRIQARAFYDQSRAEAVASQREIVLSLDDLRVLLSQFLGESATDQLIRRHHDFAEGDHVSASLIDAAEHAMAGIVGVASARTMLSNLSTGNRFGVEEVVSMFEETTKALRFNQEMIIASFETISSAISVVNPELQLVAWNRRYEEMFDYPEGMLRVGVPVEELVRYNSSRGLLGPGSPDDHVQRRVSHLRASKPYRVVRSDGRGVIEIKGSPLPGGGYVTTYEDISEFIDHQQRLEKSNEYLEQRVRERTIELEKAQHEAEEANRGKSRFLALASHDILQPLNAANLYINVLLDQAKESQAQNYDTLQHLGAAITSTETIISTLLEIAKLDTGSLKTVSKVIALNELLEPLVNECRVQLQTDVELAFEPSGLFVETDPRYLRRIVQNFLSNSIKYTASGKILVGCRRRGDRVEIQVYDTGPGIHPDDQARIFEDFYRSTSQSDIEGFGLGLAVANRFSRLLNHEIRLHSELGRGSCFSVLVPVSSGPEQIQEQESQIATSSTLTGCKVLYVDDDPANIHAMETLLSKWGCLFESASSADQARDKVNAEPGRLPDLLLMDLQLDHHNNGIMLAKELHQIWERKVPTCIVSAAQDEGLSALAASHQFEFLRKPIKPGKLRAILEQLLKRASTSD